MDIETLYDTESSDFVFKCAHCSELFSIQYFRFATLLYGAIFIPGNVYGYLGITCPNCTKDTTEKMDSMKLRGWVDHLVASPVSAVICPNPSGSSNPDSSNDNSIRSNIRFGVFRRGEAYFAKTLRETYYRSPHYLFPPSLTFGIRKTQINSTVLRRMLENEPQIQLPGSNTVHGLNTKGLPRIYYLSNLQKLIAIHSDLRKISAIYPDLIGSRDAHASFPVYKRFKRGIVGDLRLLNIITLGSHAWIDHPEHVLNLITKSIFPFKGMGLKKSFELLSSLEDNNEDETINRIWSGYYEGNLRGILEKMGFELLRDYKEISTQAPEHYCSDLTLYGLVRRYRDRILLYLKSPSKASAPGIKKISKLTMEEVQLAERAFKVRIISQDEKIAAFKIEVSKYKMHGPNYDVIITGETGTGKDLFALACHQSGDRKGEFVPVNCAAIPKDLFESELFGYSKGAFSGAVNDKIGLAEKAVGGTLFLDEIGELHIDLQAKLLRFIERHEIQPLGGAPKTLNDLNIVMATNRNLRECVGAGSFREDLYERIQLSMIIEIPPLRQRKDDIALLVVYFLEEYEQSHKGSKISSISFSDGALKFLMGYEWPRNVRELKNCVNKIINNRVFTGDRSEILIDEVSGLLPRPKMPQSQIEVTPDLILSILAKHDFNKTEAAKELRYSRRQFYRILDEMKAAGIEIPSKGKRKRILRT